MSVNSITIIGGGNLGKAIAEGLIASKFVRPNQITITRRNTASLDYLKKQKINDSIFTKKLIFEKKSVRTLEVNRVVSLILNTGRTSGKSKKEKHTDFGVLSCGVESEGFEPSSKRRIL